jgi:hypothetical protein
MRYKNLYIITTILLVIIGCTKPYAPPPIKAVTGYLVVEGVINTGNDSSRFTLSRTVSLSTTTPDFVTDAQVSVEGNDNTTYSLTGNGKGVYTSAPLNLDNTKQYRLHIITSNGDNYLSDYVGVKVTPPIDSIQYVIKNNGLQINLNTHDPANNTHYYRWDYTETWEFHSMYNSNYYSTGDTVIRRPYNKQIYYCYTSDNSTSVLIGSSAKLVQDVISTQPIAFAPATSEKVEIEYSILVNQYALTSDAYNFWTNLKKNTEQLGSIFDAQPSQINGNIHSTTSPGEPVIGYVSASTIQSKRILVNNNLLPPGWQPTPLFNCPLDSFFSAVLVNGMYVNQENQFFNPNKGGGAFIPVDAIVEMKEIVGHTGADPICVDCTLRGTLTKPPYFP